jgi:MFS family permease
MTAGAGLLAAGQLVMSLAPTGLVAASGFLLGSFGVSLFSVVGRALRQAVTPDRILGRVVTTFRLIGVGALPIGALTGGWLADSFDVRVPYLVGAAVVTGVTLAVYLIATETRIEDALRGRGSDTAGSA